MGSECSAQLAPRRGVDACLPEPCGQEECGACGLEGEGGQQVVYSPEGLQPEPPWALPASSSRSNPVDRTATGHTPPRTPAQRMRSVTPPGLPDEEHWDSLAVVQGCRLGPHMFQAVRSGQAEKLDQYIDQVREAALGQARAQHADPSAAEGCASTELAAVLNRLSDEHQNHETLLAAAAAEGQPRTVLSLLRARADPFVPDDQDNSALHCAAGGGSPLCALLVLDRMQSSERAFSTSEFVNQNGETPMDLATTRGRLEVCRALTLFDQMQADAQLRQLGSGAAVTELTGGRAHVGEIFLHLDAAARPGSPRGCAAHSSAAGQLRRASLASGLVNRLNEQLKERSLSSVVDDVCRGIRAAEHHLLSVRWDPSAPGLDLALQDFVTTAKLQSDWQNMRLDAIEKEGFSAQELDDFWSTHQRADQIAANMSVNKGDTFQVLLIVLWLYTREAWLRHVLDSLSIAIAADQGLGSSWDGEGATGATPLSPKGARRRCGQREIDPLVTALAPCAQLLQSALLWFEEAGIQHLLPTYRALSVPMLSLQRVVDRLKQRQREGGDEHSLKTGVWVSLGAGSFWSSTSSRVDAERRLLQSRCNVLLTILPDEYAPCNPKRMSLRGNCVDDTIFPLGALFRVARVVEKVSSDLDPGGGGHNAKRWPVYEIELRASVRCVDALELLSERGELSTDDLRRSLKEWVDAAPLSEEGERQRLAGRALERARGLHPAGGPAARPPSALRAPARQPGAGGSP